MSEDSYYSALEDEIVFAVDNIFKKYDRNLSLKLEEHEVQSLMRDALREMGAKDQGLQQRVKLFINRVDKDGDSKISKG